MHHLLRPGDLAIARLVLANDEKDVYRKLGVTGLMDWGDGRTQQQEAALEAGRQRSEHLAATSPKGTSGKRSAGAALWWKDPHVEHMADGTRSLCLPRFGLEAPSTSLPSSHFFFSYTVPHRCDHTGTYVL